MKKYLIISLLIFIPFITKADMLFGFNDGAGLYNSEGAQLYTCFQDQTCVGLDNVIHTRAELGVGPVPISSAPTTSPGSPNQTIVYVPVYTSPSNAPMATSTSPSEPIVGGEPLISCVLTFLNSPIPDSIGNSFVTLTWTSIGESNNATGTLYGIHNGIFAPNTINTPKDGHITSTNGTVNTYDLVGVYKAVFSDGTTCSTGN